MYICGMDVNSFGNMISGNVITNNTEMFGGDGIILRGNFNNITGNNLSANNISGILCLGNDNSVSGNNIQGNGRVDGGWGVTNSPTATGNGNTYSGNYIGGNGSSAGGIYATSGVTIRDNVIEKNTGAGIRLNGVSNTTVTGNSVSSNSAYGVLIDTTYYQINFQIFHNNFINNPTQALISNGTGTFNQAAPTGGNYWSNNSTAAQGCSDANADGFCDAPYVFSGGQDNLPLTAPVAVPAIRPATPGSGKPVLKLSSPAPVWASLTDYQNGQLSVTWTITNTGKDFAMDAAFHGQLTSSTDSNDVSAIFQLQQYRYYVNGHRYYGYRVIPIPFASVIPGGESAAVTVKYKIPAGVGSWHTALQASATDSEDTGYTYP